MDLRKNALLKHLAHEEWMMFEVLMKQAHATRQGAFVYMESDPCKTLDIIIEGSVYVKRHDLEGRTLMVERFNPGDFLGANLLFSSKATYPMHVIAETDCKIVKLPKVMVLSWCQGNTAFLEAFLNAISDRARVLVSTIHKLSTGTLRERLLDDFHKEKNHKNEIILKITKKEMAERYGVQRTSLSRELQKMTEDQIIEKINRNTYRLL